MSGGLGSIELGPETRVNARFPVIVVRELPGKLPSQLVAWLTANGRLCAGPIHGVAMYANHKEVKLNSVSVFPPLTQLGCLSVWPGGVKSEARL